MECACATFRTKKPQRSAYKILPSSRERATPSLRMGNHALVARPRVLTCPPPGAHCPHTPRIHHAAARPAWASPKTSWPPEHASPRRLVCTKPHTRDSHKSMRWCMVAHHALDAGNGHPPASGRISTSWPLSPACAPRQTRARHPRKGSKHCRFIASVRTALEWSYDHAGINTSLLPVAKACPYPISNGPRTHR